MPSEQCVYWEEQRESLCAVHALNSLVQQPMFREVELAEIAQELDAKEDALLGMKRTKGAASRNVSASGDFSVRVLTAALRSKGLDLVLGHSVSALLRETGVALQSNARGHWWTLRRVQWRWYGLCRDFMGSASALAGAVVLCLDICRQGGRAGFGR